MTINSPGFSPKFFALFSCVIFFSFVQQGFCEVMSIKGDKVTLRANPEKNAKVLWEYGNGFPMEVIKKQGDWYFVKDFENDSGWVHLSGLRKNQQVIVKANKDEKNTVNLRSGPNSNNQVVGSAHYGVVFSVLERQGSWIQVHHESGLNGWIKADLLWGL